MTRDVIADFRLAFTPGEVREALRWIATCAPDDLERHARRAASAERLGCVTPETARTLAAALTKRRAELAQAPSSQPMTLLPSPTPAAPEESFTVTRSALKELVAETAAEHGRTLALNEAVAAEHDALVVRKAAMRVLCAVSCTRLELLAPVVERQLRRDRALDAVVVVDEGGVVRRGVSPETLAQSVRAEYERIEPGRFFR